jgi:hypothetical protein
MRGLMLSLMLLCRLSLAGETECRSALSVCVDLSKAQDAQAEHLKADVQKLEQELSREQPPSGLQSIPWALWMVLGGVAGYGAAKALGR